MNELDTPKSPRMVPASALDPKWPPSSSDRPQLHLAADGHDEHRAGCHEADQPVVEGLALVVGIVGRGQFVADLHELGTNDLQAFVFKARDDASHETALNGIRLQDDQCEPP